MSKAILPQEVTGIARNKKEPNLIRSGRSTLYKGTFTADPRIRARREESLREARAALGQFTERSNALRSRLEGNQGALMEARTRPVTEMVNRGLQGLSRRGLSGSSFYGQAAASGGTAIGDARAQAEMETLEALTGIDRAQIAASFNMADRLNAASGEEFQQMMAGMGMAANQAALLAQMYEQFLNRRQEAYESERQKLHEFGMSAWNSYTGGGGGTGPFMTQPQQSGSKPAGGTG